MDNIIIGHKCIGLNNKPFVVAEMSGNHNHSLERALSIVEAAAKAGVDAIKLQTYTADTMTLDIANGDFLINDSNSLWTGKSLYQLYKEAYTPWEWHQPIFNKCKELGIIGFSTPFDETAVDFLESLNVPCYKIASFENNHLPLIKKVAATGKPVMISTGMATLCELDEAVSTARNAGCGDIILLKCTSSYPASPADSNLQTIPHMRKLFNVQVGLSDHTLGICVALASIALGTTVIEKHLTLRRIEGGVDAAFSLEPEEMKMLVTESQKAWQALGDVSYCPRDTEKKSVMFRRSIYATRDIAQGESFSKDNIKIIRPGFGLEPKHFEWIIGKTAKSGIKKGQPLKWDMII